MVEHLAQKTAIQHLLSRTEQPTSRPTLHGKRGCLAAILQSSKSSIGGSEAHVRPFPAAVGRRLEPWRVACGYLGAKRNVGGARIQWE